MSEPTVGVLALQGGFAAHARILAGLGPSVREIRRPGELADIAGLVIPGGESSTLLKLMDYEPEWWPALRAFHEAGGAFLGTCAGLIFLAREVTGPSQRSLGLLDAKVARNAYGRQLDSFEATGHWEDDGSELAMVFIRAPRISQLGAGVEVLVRHEGDPVVVRQGRVLAASFHPELCDESSLHRRFLEELTKAPPREASEL